MSNLRNTNPWLGLISYEFEDSYKFFGRYDESDQLSKAITNNPVTVIYGSSGSGKTSIIKAGIFPKLLQEYYMPVYIRLLHDSEVSYAAQILRSIKYAASFQGVDIEQTCDFNNEVNDENALWVYLHSHTFWRKDNYPVIPLIVIDQFEEIFTLNQYTKKISDFFNFIDELYDNLPPSNIKNIIESTDSYIPFHDDTKYKLVLSLREDFLARLEDYSREIPILRKNRFGLKSMDGRQAFEVITSPIPDLVDEEVALKIVRKISGHTRDISKDELSGISVETSILSLFCSELFKRMEEQSIDKITDSLVDSAGDNIIEDYYTNTMRLVPAFTARYIENNLLTKSGFRNTIALEDAIENGVDKNSIEVLQYKRLIKIEIVNGTERIEFTHDILCKVAKDKRDLRKNSIVNAVGKKYIIDGILSYTFFLIAFLCLWDAGSGLGKIIVIFPFSILLSHITRLLIIAKERKFICLGVLSSIFNFVTLMFICVNFRDFAIFLGNVTVLNGNLLTAIFIFVFLIYFVISPQSFAYKNQLNKMLFTDSISWEEIFTLQCYRRYPDLLKIEKEILLPAILLISAYLIGSYSNVWLSLIVIVPLCLLVFSILCSFFDLVRIQKNHKLIFYLSFSLLLLILFGSQYIFVLKGIMLYSSLGVSLVLTFLYVLKYTSSEYSVQKKSALAAGIWLTSFLIFPLIIIGNNIFL